MSTERIALACVSCGSTQFRHPSGRELQPEDVLTCNGCERQVTVGEARKQAAEAVRKALTNTLGSMFKPR
ncbi:ECs_2282 family putative zinc-binding protein [Comamonas sp. MYb69]|uniref:ECs_2282 family putative zinc-binding protein n=1 Tax=Comamonas sp. MYb69 TaxID=1848650 RepID=UPI00403F7DF8